MKPGVRPVKSSGPADTAQLNNADSHTCQQGNIGKGDTHSKCLHSFACASIFGTLGSSSYVRYFEFVAAPGMILRALNLSPVRKCLEWKPLVWLGTLSGTIYYVHNNIMENYLILDSSLGIHLDFSSGWVLLAVPFLLP